MADATRDFFDSLAGRAPQVLTVGQGRLRGDRRRLAQRGDPFDPDRTAGGSSGGSAAALSEVDVLAMPTATHYAHRHDPDASLSQRVLRGWTMLANTGSFDATGHPALSIPAGAADGLPVGVMLVGRHFDEAGLLRVARSYEIAHGWRPERGVA